LAAAAAVIACAGCGAGSGAPGAQVRGPGPLSPGSSTAGQNRALTQAEAQRLLRLAPLPRGATPTRTDTGKLAGPALGTPNTSSLIDLHRFVRVSMPMSAAWGYVMAHPPAGLTDSGTGSSGTTGGAVTSEGIGWNEPDRAYATGLERDVSLASVPGGTLIRADGMGEWIDPRPIKDTASGHRVRVTVAGGCPAGDRGVVGVSNPGSGLSDALLPAAPPTAALICAYGGLNPPHVFGLFKRVRLPVGEARRLAQQARRLPLGHIDGDVTSCPEDSALFDVIAFSYAGSPDVDLGYKASGCQSIGNGHILLDGGLNLAKYVTEQPG
jgi:hypothetical protein